MTINRKVNQSSISLRTGDITDTDVEAFVYYARNDLKLGAGYGNAIAVRGGPSIQKELDEIGELEVGEAVVTGAGNMKSRYIIHAVGPKFQEENTESKLERTIVNSLKRAEEKGIKQIAFPPMGAGFYGVPLPVCADVMLRTFKKYLQNSTAIEEIIVCALDKREHEPFQKKLETLE